jgi:hypothetical protein
MPSNDDLKVELDEKVEELETELDEKLDENVEEVEDELITEAKDKWALETASFYDPKKEDDVDHKNGMLANFNDDNQIVKTEKGFMLMKVSDGSKPFVDKDIQKVIDKIQKDGDNADGIAQLAKKLKTVPMALVKANMEEESKFKDDLDALVESEATLSEGFKSKATVIFEAALGSKVNAEVSRLEAEYENALEEAVTSNISEMAEQVDSYLNYVVESWMKENEVAISAGIRADIAESFMKNLKDVFVEHYVEVPEGKTDLVDELAEKLEESKASLDDEISKNIALNESNSELVREKNDP